MPGARQLITLLIASYCTWGGLSFAVQQSPYLGQSVVNPEELSGLWETSDGKGGAVGIHLRLVTTATGNAKTLTNTPQFWEHLEVGVYQRKGAQIEFGEENFFTDSPTGGRVTFQNRRLQLTAASFDLDLTQQAEGQWVGRLHRESFDSLVTLRRPDATNRANMQPIVGTPIVGNKIVGTWLLKSIDPAHISCIHIAQQGENAFIGWSDSLRAPGVEIYGKNIVWPETALESYGVLMNVHLETDGKFTLELHALSPTCCSHKFVGRVAQDGNLINGDWPSGPNQTPQSGSWVKVAGDSCVRSVQPRPW